MTTTDDGIADATGATAEQLEAAAARFRLGPWTAQSIASQVRFWSAKLIPPDHRLLGPEDIAALRRALFQHDDVPTQRDYERLIALFGEPDDEPKQPTSDDYADAADRFDRALYGEPEREP